MRPVKRIEIVTGTLEFDRVVKVLEDHGITGFVVHRDVGGRGDRRLDSVDVLTGEPRYRMILTTCPPELIGEIVESLRPLLTTYDGACVVYDAQCVIHGQRSGAVR
jgi:nitrogen regulatory protein PII